MDPYGFRASLACGPVTGPKVTENAATHAGKFGPCMPGGVWFNGFLILDELAVTSRVLSRARRLLCGFKTARVRPCGSGAA
jgi:hypothetical protein